MPAPHGDEPAFCQSENVRTSLSLDTRPPNLTGTSREPDRHEEVTMSTQRRAVVTGGGAGIGTAIAQRLAAAGIRVAVLDANEAGAAAVADGLKASHGTDALGLRCDVTVTDEVRAAIAEVALVWGGIDILVNNAGIVGPHLPLIEYPEVEFVRVVDVDLLGAFRVTQAALPHMLPLEWGRIVNIASIAGKAGNPRMTGYAAAKAGLIGLTKALAAELATTGILVNCVTPGGVRGTNIARAMPPEAARSAVFNHPLGRLAVPEEVAAMVAWLCSDEVSFSTGAVFDISGGRATY
jgi:3-oxoacyl-[acyl-carrier protein] reductase